MEIIMFWIPQMHLTTALGNYLGKHDLILLTSASRSSSNSTKAYAERERATRIILVYGTMI